jgi:hypothetical protein
MNTSIQYPPAEVIRRRVSRASSGEYQRLPVRRLRRTRASEPPMIEATVSIEDLIARYLEEQPPQLYRCGA